MATNNNNGGKPKPVNKKTATKICSDCDRQLPVACKSCPCGNTFRKPPTPEVSPTTSLQRRTTQRIRRGRPNFFNAMEFVTPTTGRRRRTSSATSSTDDAGGKRKRGRPRQSSNRSKDEEGQKEEEDMFANVPPEKAHQYHLILADLNRKFTGQNFKPA